MTIEVVLLLSILFQCIAAFLALRMMPITGRRLVWIVVAGAMLMMAVRRCITYWRFVSSDVFLHPDMTAELIALAIAFLIMSGMFLIEPAFSSIQKSRQLQIRLNRALKILTECNQAMIRATEESALIQNICDIIVRIGQYRFVWVGFAEYDSRRTVRPVGRAGYEDGYLDNVQITWNQCDVSGKGPTGTAICTAAPVINRNSAENPEFAPWRDQAVKRGYASSIALPMIAGEKVLGTLNIYSEHPNAFDAAEVALLYELALDLAFGITKLRAEMRNRLNESKIKQALARLEMVLENTPMVSVQGFDRTGIVLHWNKASEQLYGFSADHALGMRIQELILSEDAIPQFNSELVDICSTGRPTKPAEWQVRTKTGRNIWVYSTMFPVFDNDEVIEIFCMDVDITDRKLAEEERKRLIEVLEEKNKELESIIHVMGHDLRTPLVTINGFSREMKSSCLQLNTLLEEDKNIPDKSKSRIRQIITDEIPEAVRLIIASASKMSSLLEGLMKLARLEYKTPEKVQIDMNSMVKGIVDALGFQAKCAGVEFLMGDLPSCVGDEAQLYHVFVNLIDNAIKYLHSTDHGIISISGAGQTGQVVYCVKDNGIGIEKSNLDNIFKMFYRVNGESTAGQGVGLSIVRRIVNRHNGRVWAESLPGQGSSFFVALPEL